MRILTIPIAREWSCFEFDLAVRFNFSLKIEKSVTDIWRGGGARSRTLALWQRSVRGIRLAHFNAI